MVDVRGDDRPAARHLVADKFGRDVLRQSGAETLAIFELIFGPIESGLASQILPVGDIDHLIGNDPGARAFKLCDRCAIETTQRLILDRIGPRQMRFADIAIVFRFDVSALISFHIAARLCPILTQAGNALFNINVDGRVREWAGRVVDPEYRLLGIRQADLTERHLEIVMPFGRRMHFA
ncbi:hypothetical protein MnTg02_02688 [bacterium MnTg02]|nr:hypothetical protein MnTg02_02688 [bacterium MnTg02]